MSGRRGNGRAQGIRSRQRAAAPGADARAASGAGPAAPGPAGMGGRLRLGVIEVAKACAAGLIAGAAVGVLGFLGGMLLGTADLPSGIEGAKNALFVIAALLLFVLAGMLLIKGKKAETFEADENGWRRHFAVIGVKAALGGAAVGVAALAIALDYVQFLLR